MAEKRIICVGSGNRLTNAASIHPENGRYYRYPDPGLIYTWEGDATAFQQSELPGHELVAAYPGGPVIQGYGMIVLGDTYTKILKAPLESNETVTLRRRDFETKIVSSLKRARGLLDEWSRYGALMIEGAFPSVEELANAMDQRKRRAMNLLNTAIDERKSGRRGLYTPTERAWAYEFGFLLPETVDSMARVPKDEKRMPCPECGEAILPAAKVCIHCKTKFRGFTVSEMIANQALEEATRPTVNA